MKGLGKATALGFACHRRRFIKSLIMWQMIIQPPKKSIYWEMNQL